MRTLAIIMVKYTAHRVKMRTLAIIMVKYFRQWGDDEDIVNYHG